MPLTRPVLRELEMFLKRLEQTLTIQGHDGQRNLTYQE